MTLRTPYLLRGFLVLVTLARQAYAHPGGHVAHTLREEELVEFGVHAHIANREKKNTHTKCTAGATEEDTMTSLR